MAKAEMYWQMARDLNAPGERPVVEEILAELKGMIDLGKPRLRAQRPTLGKVYEYVTSPEYDGELDDVVEELLEERAAEDELESEEEDEDESESDKFEEAEEDIFADEDIFDDEDIFADEEIK